MAEGQPEKPLVKKNRPPSSPGCNPLDYFMWSVVDREANKQPYNTLASLKAKISEVMADKDKEVGISLNKCVSNMHGRPPPTGSGCPPRTEQLRYL
jgi:hypothetical protein